MATRESCLKKISLINARLVESSAKFHDPNLGSGGRIKVTIHAELPDEVTHVEKSSTFPIFISIVAYGYAKDAVDTDTNPTFELLAKSLGEFQVNEKSVNREDIEKCLNNIVPPLYSFTRHHVLDTFEKMAILNTKLPYDAIFSSSEQQ